MVVTAQISRELIEKASFLGQRKGSVTIFLIKGEKESPTHAELSLKAAASTRGIRVMLVHEGQFATAFSEVKMR
jgi:diphthamide biosynthesis methyltransferase